MTLTDKRTEGHADRITVPTFFTYFALKTVAVRTNTPTPAFERLLLAKSDENLPEWRHINDGQHITVTYTHTHTHAPFLTPNGSSKAEPLGLLA